MSTHYYSATSLIFDINIVYIYILLYILFIFYIYISYRLLRGVTHVQLWVMFLTLIKYKG